MNLNKLLLGVKSFAPELLLGAGIGTAALAMVATGKAAVKAHNVLTDAAYTAQDPNTTEEQKTIIKKETTKKVLKCYIPTVILASTSTACLLSSFHIQKGRELALASAYVAIKESYDDYRKRVEAKLGQEEEKKLSSGEVREKQVIGHDKDGKEISREHIVGYNDKGCFRYLFDESNPNWMPDAKDNYFTLFAIQKNLNERLRRRGYVFLYEVYKALGIEKGILGPERWRAAHLLGWLYDPDKPNGDNFIDFGIFKDEMGNLLPYNAAIADEPSIWLVFNPDGDILLGSNGSRIFTETEK